MESINLQSLEMNQIINSVRIRLRNIIERYNAIIVSPDEWPAAQGYGPWIEEVWANYISNA